MNWGAAMNTSAYSRVRTATVFAMATCSASVAFAADPTISFPAGVACDFALDLTASGGNKVQRTFYDKRGNVVRLLSAGKGAALTFANPQTGSSISVRPSGANTRTTLNTDGSSTVMSTGHAGLIMFPSDIPAGPSTTLYVGRIVYTIGTDGVFTLEATSGPSTDVCAVLA
jgi:hypothetical protein